MCLTLTHTSLVNCMLLLNNTDTTALAVYNQGMDLNLAPLLQLHTSIAACLETAVQSYTDSPSAASTLRRSALLCRENLLGSMKLLRKIEQTATQVV